MVLEVLLSTMNRNNTNIISVIDKMNISTDIMIINQSNYNDEIEIYRNSNKVKMISNCERGLSKSRNLAIKNTMADICIVADDDIIYVDDYEEIILNEYKRYPDADIIAFKVPSTNKDRVQKDLKKTKYVGYINSGKIASFQMTFKKDSLKDKGIMFDENFGAGSIYSCGEENILLFDALKKGLKIVQSNKKIGIVTHEESTWFKGFTSSFFKDKGAIYTRMTKKYSYLWIIQFAIRKYNLYCESISLKSAIKYMILGKREYDIKNK